MRPNKSKGTVEKTILTLELNSNNEFIKKSFDEFNDIVNNMIKMFKTPVCVVNKDFKILTFNKHFSDELFYSEKDLKKYKLCDLIINCDNKDFKSLFENGDENLSELKVQVLTKINEFKDYNLDFSSFTLASETYAVVSFVDACKNHNCSYIKDVDKYEEEIAVQMEELEQKSNEINMLKSDYQELYQHAVNPYVTVTSSLKILDSNHKARDLFGLKANNYDYLTKYLYNGYKYTFLNNIINNKSQESFFVEFIINNEIKRFRAKVIKKETSDDEYLCFFTDIEHEYQLLESIKNNSEKESLLFNQSKLASMGEMIGNIAHQWRQPLNSISVTASGMKTENMYGILDLDSIDIRLDEICKSTEYLSATIDLFRNFLMNEKETSKLNIKNEIEDSIFITKDKLLSKRVELITNINLDDEYNIKGVKSELANVVINLINNASDAFDGKNINEKFIELNVTIKDNENIIINIEDNAGGIPSNIITQIFEPYFTTKHKAQGTGLGLYMSHKIINERFNGTLKVHNTENGACFTIELPLSK